jgi:hypothetical protein
MNRIIIIILLLVNNIYLKAQIEIVVHPIDSNKSKILLYNDDNENRLDSITTFNDMYYIDTTNKVIVVYNLFSGVGTFPKCKKRYHFTLYTYNNLNAFDFFDRIDFSIYARKKNFKLKRTNYITFLMYKISFNEGKCIVSYSNDNFDTQYKVTLTSYEDLIKILAMNKHLLYCDKSFKNDFKIQIRKRKNPYCEADEHHKYNFYGMPMYL